MSDIVSGGMSDNQPLSDIDRNDVLETSKHHDLRARITTALQYAAGRQSSWQGLLDCVVMADAVIAELQLTQERDVSQWRNEAGELIVISRYVTDWKADDECP